MLHTVERHEPGPLRTGPHHHPATGNPVGIERMERLPQLVENEIGDVHHVILRIESYGPQALLHPFGRRPYPHSAYHHAGIPRGALRSLYRHIRHGHSLPVGHLRRGKRKRRLPAMGLQVGRQVAGHAVMRHGVGPVGGKAYLDDRIRLQTQIEGRRRPRYGIRRKHHDALVTGADAQFVLGADHTEGIRAAYPALLYLEALLRIRRIENGAHGSHEHLLPGRHVRSPAHDLQRFLQADLHLRQVQVIGIGMVDTGEHLAHDHSLQSAPDTLERLGSVHFEPYIGKDGQQFVQLQVGVYIAFKPLIRYFHRSLKFAY